MEAKASSCWRSSGSVAWMAASRNADAAAGDNGECDACSGGTVSIGATFTVSSRAWIPASAAAVSNTSAYSRSFDFQIGEVTRKTSLPSRTLASLHWLAAGSGRD